MSFITAAGLSMKNLLTKKARTILVALAGSIGIIGITLISAVSTGFQNYIDKIEEVGYRLAVIDARTAADDYRELFPSILGFKRNSRKLEDVEDIGVAHLILECEAKEIEIADVVTAFVDGWAYEYGVQNG